MVINVIRGKNFTSITSKKGSSHLIPTLKSGYTSALIEQNKANILSSSYGEVFSLQSVHVLGLSCDKVGPLFSFKKTNGAVRKRAQTDRELIGKIERKKVI